MRNSMKIAGTGTAFHVCKNNECESGIEGYTEEFETYKQARQKGGWEFDEIMGCLTALCRDCK